MDPVAALLDSPQLVRYGLPEPIKGESPAAGAQFTQAIDRGFWARLVCVFCRIVTDANAANRTVRLEYLDNEGNICDVMGNPVTYPASQTEDFSFSVYQPRGEWEVAATNLVPLHPIILPPSWSFRIAVNNIQVTDQLSRIRFTWEKFYPPDQVPGIPA